MSESQTEKPFQLSFKLVFFKRIFKDCFNVAGNKCRQDAMGVSVPVLGAQAQDAINTAKIGGAAVGIAPFGAVGTTIAVAAEIKLNEELEQTQKNRAINFSSILKNYTSDEINILIDMVANELIRIYEHQINFLKEEDSLATIAEYAACTAVSYLKDADLQTKPFNRNDILKSIVTCGSEHKHEKYASLLTENKDHWNVKDFFTKPLILQENFLTLSLDNKKQVQSIQNYGYRKNIMCFTDGQYELFSNLDIKCAHATKTEHYKQIPSNAFVLCDFNDLLGYQSHLQSSILPKLSFKQFVRNKISHGISNPFKLVYRGQRIKKLILDNGDFTDTDFAGTTFKYVSAKNSNFTRCSFVQSRLVNCNLEGARLNFAELCFAQFSGEKMSFRDTTIDDAIFSNAKAGSEIDFRIKSKQRAIFDKFNYAEIKLTKINLIQHPLQGGDPIMNQRKPAIAAGTKIPKGGKLDYQQTFNATTFHAHPDDAIKMMNDEKTRQVIDADREAALNTLPSQVTEAGTVIEGEVTLRYAATGFTYSQPESTNSKKPSMKISGDFINLFTAMSRDYQFFTSRLDEKTISVRMEKKKSDESDDTSSAFNSLLDEFKKSISLNPHIEELNLNESMPQLTIVSNACVIDEISAMFRQISQWNNSYIDKTKYTGFFCWQEKQVPVKEKEVHHQESNEPSTCYIQ